MVFFNRSPLPLPGIDKRPKLFRSTDILPRLFSGPNQYRKKSFVTRKNKTTFNLVYHGLLSSSPWVYWMEKNLDFLIPYIIVYVLLLLKMGGGVQDFYTRMIGGGMSNISPSNSSKGWRNINRLQYGYRTRTYTIFTLLRSMWYNDWFFKLITDHWSSTTKAEDGRTVLQRCLTGEETWWKRREHECDLDTKGQITDY